MVYYKIMTALAESRESTEAIDANHTIFQTYLAGRMHPDLVHAAHGVAMDYLEADNDTLRAEAAIREHGGVDLHRHLEGMLTAIDLYEISEEIGKKLGFSVQFRDETWEKIFARMNGESLDGKKLAPFESFLGMLATFAVRGIYENAMLQAKTRIEDKSFNKSLEFVSETVMKTVFERVLKKAHAEGIRVLDLMGSPLAMTAEGNLFDYALNEFPGIDELDQIAGAWEMRTKEALGPAKISWSTLLTTRRYVELFDEVVGEDGDKYRRWNEDMKPGDDNRMRVGLRLCFRREQDAEQLLLRNVYPYPGLSLLSSQSENYLLTIADLNDRGLITGINIGGDESKWEWRLRNFSVFLKLFRDFGGSITVHVGETTEESKEIGWDNMEYALMVLNVDRLGHAKQLFDGSPRMNRLIKEMIENPDQFNALIEVNIFSNFMLGLVKDLHEHPILTHSLELTSWGIHLYQFYNFIHDRLLFTTDDPNISEPGKNYTMFRALRDMVKKGEVTQRYALSYRAGNSLCPLAKELALIAKYSDLLDFFGGIEGYIKHQIARWS